MATQILSAIARAEQAYRATSKQNANEEEIRLFGDYNWCSMEEFNNKKLPYFYLRPISIGIYKLCDLLKGGLG